MAQQAAVVDLPTVQVQTSGEQTAWGAVDGYVPTTSGAGTKTDTPLIETPRSISVVSRQEMTDRGAQSVVDAVGYSAGVVSGTYGYDPRFDPIYVRGFAVTQIGAIVTVCARSAAASPIFAPSPMAWSASTSSRARPACSMARPRRRLIDRVSKMPTDKAFGEIELQGGSPNWYQAAFDIGVRPTRMAPCSIASPASPATRTAR